MEYIKKDQGSYQLHMIKTKNYKSITVKVYFKEKIEKENVTIRNFLNDMLFLSSQEYPSKKELTKALQDLYAARVTYQTRRLGVYLDTCYTLRVLHDKYTEDGNFRKSVKLLSSLLFEPKVEKEMFCEEEFTTIYEQMKAELSAIKEEKERYALFQLFKHLSTSGEVSINGVGYLEDLEKITRENLYQYYKKMLHHDMVDIYILGDFEEENVMEIFKESFPLETFKPRRYSPFTKIPPVSKPNIYYENFKSQQSQLSIACEVGPLTTYERNYPLSLYNIILGSGSHSYLFQEIREKSNLAYYVNSSPSKFDHLIIIQSGIAIGKEKQAIKIIEKQIKRLAKKNFSEEDVAKAKEFFTTSIDNILESPLQIIESYYMMEILGVDDLKTKREKMKKVTKEEVEKVASKVKIHTIFYLKGDE